MIHFINLMCIVIIFSWTVQKSHSWEVLSILDQRLSEIISKVWFSYLEAFCDKTLRSMSEIRTLGHILVVHKFQVSSKKLVLKSKSEASLGGKSFWWQCKVLHTITVKFQVS